MFYGARDQFAAREANDSYFGAEEPGDPDEVHPEPIFSDTKEQLGFDDATDGFHLDGQGPDYERGWQRGNAVRRLRP